MDADFSVMYLFWLSIVSRLGNVQRGTVHFPRPKDSYTLEPGSTCLGRTKKLSKRLLFQTAFRKKQQLGQSALHSKQISMGLESEGF
jgi:hypothetical protein